MKEELLRLIDEGRRKESETFVPLVDDSEPDRPGRWTAKDNLAHLNAWREVAIGEIDAVLLGVPAPKVAESDDEQNAKFYAETHAIRAAQVLGQASRSWRELAGRIADCTDEQLNRERPTNSRQRLWQAVPGNALGHLADHLGYWYADAGDDARAEQAAVWGRDVARAIPSDVSRATGDYNLGCFYAKRGRGAEALQYFRVAFELDPELREWAKADPDLDPIRAEPEAERLLAD